MLGATDELMTYVKDELLKACEHSAGVICNATVTAKAMDVTWYRARGRKRAAVGVLIGIDTQTRVAGEMVWLKHVACTEAFTASSNPNTRTRGGSKKSTANVQERLALHSFSQGDIVLYKSAEVEDPHVEIAVYGVMCKDGSAEEQGRKHLVLYETASETFFVGNWTQYQPVHTGATSSGVVHTVSDSVKARMVGLFEESSEVKQITSSMLKKRSEEPPPQSS